MLNKEDLLNKDQKHMWHHMSRHNPPPLVITEADGAWIVDIDGNRYFDGMSGLWCVNIGYGRKELAEAAYEQLVKMPYYPLTQSHVPAIELSHKISEWLEGEYRIFFSNSGSEANETAFKIARQYHHQRGEPSRTKFISRHRAYHGNTMASLSATGQAIRKYKYEPLAQGFQHVPPPYCYRCPFGKTYGSCEIECAKAIEDAILWEGKETVAGVIMEPVITGGGIIVPPQEYVKKVSEICNKHGVLLIVDEVICGMGRSGKRFGHQNFFIKPDIITMAKGITSGYLPLSATAVRAELYESFKEEGEAQHFRHVNTFGGNPAACALALKNLQIIEREGLIAQAERTGAELEKRLLPLLTNGYVGDIRRFGLLIAIEMVENKEAKTPASEERMKQLVNDCKKRGLIIGKNSDTVPQFNNILMLAPPLITTAKDIDFIVSIITEVMLLNSL
jgi:taurine-pyruvate aminotransferase